MTVSVLMILVILFVVRTVKLYMWVSVRNSCVMKVLHVISPLTVTTPTESSTVANKQLKIREGKVMR